jgi:hypothetical protein
MTRRARLLVSATINDHRLSSSRFTSSHFYSMCIHGCSHHHGGSFLAPRVKTSSPVSSANPADHRSKDPLPSQAAPSRLGRGAGPDPRLKLWKRHPEIVNAYLPDIGTVSTYVVYCNNGGFGEIINQSLHIGILPILARNGASDDRQSICRSSLSHHLHLLLRRLADPCTPAMVLVK